MPNNITTSCSFNSPDGVKTDEGEGVSFQPIWPDGNMTIKVTLSGAAPSAQYFFTDFSGEQRWLIHQTITTTQAKEIGKWLCQRAREAKRDERRTRWRQRFTSLLNRQY
jgi:hypothetical protein